MIYRLYWVSSQQVPYELPPAQSPQEDPLAKRNDQE
jgi:hypothetical protein